MYSTRIILNSLGVQDYGIFDVVAGFVSLFSFLSGAMTSAIQRFYNFELGKNGSQGSLIVYNASIRIQLILSVIIVCITEPIGIWYIQNKMCLPIERLSAAEWVFHCSVLSMVANVLTTPYVAAITAHEKMDFYALISIIDALLKMGIAIILSCVSGDSLIMYGTFIFIINFFDLFAYFIYAKLKFPEIKLLSIVPFKVFKNMLSFCGWSTFGSIAYLLREQGVNLLLNSFYGPILNAAKGVANQVNGALQGFITSIVTPSRPQIIQSYSQGNVDRVWNLTYSVSKLTFLFFWVMSLPICMNVDFILNLWLGAAVPEHASKFILIMLFTNTYGTLVAPISTCMQATGKLSFYQLLSSASNLFSVPLAYLFLIIFKEPEFVFIALFITMFTNLFAGILSAKKYAQLIISEYLKTVLWPCSLVLFISAPIFFLLTLLLRDSILSLLLECIISILVVGVISYFLALNRKEQELVKLIMNKIKNLL